MQSHEGGAYHLGRRLGGPASHGGGRFLVSKCQRGPPCSGFPNTSFGFRGVTTQVRTQGAQAVCVCASLRERFSCTRRNAHVSRGSS